LAQVEEDSDEEEKRKAERHREIIEKERQQRVQQLSAWKVRYKEPGLVIALNRKVSIITSV